MTELGNWGDGWPNNKQFVVFKITKEEIAQFIRDNVTDDSVTEHLDNEDECLALHPIHDAYTMDGKLLQAYVNVDSFAAMLADWLNSK